MPLLRYVIRCVVKSNVFSADLKQPELYDYNRALKTLTFIYARHYTIAQYVLWPCDCIRLCVRMSQADVCKTKRLNMSTSHDSIIKSIICSQAVNHRDKKREYPLLQYFLIGFKLIISKVTLVGDSGSGPMNLSGQVSPFRL